VALGADIAADRARPTYDDGLLRIELPLVDPDPKSRSVPIEVAQHREGGRSAG
jgi:HSP20 family molecular chaperone IbpA